MTKKTQRTSLYTVTNDKDCYDQKKKVIIVRPAPEQTDCYELRKYIRAYNKKKQK